MALIRYHVEIPRLEGLTEAQRDRALTEYMRESNRQMELVLSQMQKEIDSLRQADEQED